MNENKKIISDENWEKIKEMLPKHAIVFMTSSDGLNLDSVATVSKYHKGIEEMDSLDQLAFIFAVKRNIDDFFAETIKEEKGLSILRQILMKVKNYGNRN